MYRAAVVDVTGASQFNQFERLVDLSSPWSADGYFDITLPEYGFGLTGLYNDSQMRTYSTVPNVEFDLTFNLSAPLLFNGGVGTWQAGNETVNQWSIPAGETTGWLKFNGNKLEVDTKRSITWYDRQWGGGPPFWTWFELHLETGRPGDDLTAVSVWYWDTVEAGKGAIATARDAQGVQKVVPVISLIPSNRTYTSPSSNATYNLDWQLLLADGTDLSISCIKEDQELFAVGGMYPTYEGYISVNGTYDGYGVVEIVPPGILGY